MSVISQTDDPRGTRHNVISESFHLQSISHDIELQTVRKNRINHSAICIVKKKKELRGYAVISR